MDLYDDISGPVENTSNTSAPGTSLAGTNESPARGGTNSEGNNGNAGANGVYSQSSGSMGVSSIARRFQLYIGNLTWVSFLFISYKNYYNIHNTNNFSYIYLHIFLLFFFFLYSGLQIKI